MKISNFRAEEVRENLSAQKLVRIRYKAVWSQSLVQILLCCRNLGQYYLPWKLVFPQTAPPRWVSIVMNALINAYVFPLTPNNPWVRPNLGERLSTQARSQHHSIS